MRVPPNLKRRARRFQFTELSLTAVELERMCVIPSRGQAPVAASIAVLPRMPPVSMIQRPTFKPTAPARRTRRTARPLKAAAVAGMAWLALPGCFDPPASLKVSEAYLQLTHHSPIEVVRVERPAAPVEQAPVEVAVAPAAKTVGRARASAHRPAPQVATATLLDKASTAMDAGNYRIALSLYVQVIRRQPTDADALFGAALAAHELKDSRGSTTFLARALQARPNHPLANVLAGFNDQVGKRFGDARTHYDRFLSVEDSGAQADEIRAVLASLPAPVGATVAAAR